MAKSQVVGRCRRRKCRHCGELYQADVRNRGRQEYCGRPGCRLASKRAAQKRWLGSEKGRNYFRGPVHVDRVRQWRAANPGYSRRTADGGALQDISTGQVIDIQGAIEVTPAIGARVVDPLQDIMASQGPLLIGLIANLTGSLQDDIAETARRFICCGRDILGRGR